jgi:MFS family permease
VCYTRDMTTGCAPDGERLGTAWGHYPPAVRRLVWARGFRSLGQGLMVVDFALYLRALGWHAGAIGLLFSAAGLVGAGLGLGIGPASDRYGPKPFILVYEGLTVLSGVLAALTASPPLLAAMAVVAGFGRGQSGVAGPFGPAEQAWLARQVPAPRRSRLFGINAAVGFAGMGVGALAAGLVQVLARRLPGALAFRPLFLLVALGSGVNLGLLAPLPGPPPVGDRSTAPGSGPDRDPVTRRENRDLLRLAATNVMNGLAVGLTGPLIAYWFAVRFGIRPAAVGSLLAVAFFATAASSLVTGAVAERVGPVRAVVAIRLGGVLMLALLPLVGNVLVAGVLYTLRSVLNRGSLGLRQAVSVSLTRDTRRGLAAGLSTASMRLPASVGPLVAGWLMDSGNLALPFFLGAALQLGYAVLYGRLFGHLDQDLSRPAAKT